MTEHAKITVFLHQCSSLTTTVSHIIAVFRVRQCFANKNKNCASQDCSASHHCRLVSNLFEIRHAKHLWFTQCQKKLSFTHHTSPLLNWRRPETCKTKNQNSSTCHANFFKKIMQHAGPNRRKNVCLGFGCFHATCKNEINMLRGPFFQHERRPKWPLPVLCCTHRWLSS